MSQFSLVRGFFEGTRGNILHIFRAYVTWKILKNVSRNQKKNPLFELNLLDWRFFYLTSFALSVSMSVSHNKYEWQQDTIAPLFIIGKYYQNLRNDKTKPFERKTKAVTTWELASTILWFLARKKDWLLESMWCCLIFRTLEKNLAQAWKTIQWLYLKSYLVYW